MKFSIPMKDQTIEFHDVIDLSEEQRDIIIANASSRTMTEWLELEKGMKIPLEQWQCDVVLAHKKSLVASKDERALLKDRTIIFTKHAKARVALRVDRVDPSRPPKLDSLLLVIKLVVESDTVDDAAEWKGHQNLVYTLIHNGYGERFKISVSFETIGNEYLKVITVSNDHIDELTVSLANRPDIRSDLEKLKKRLLDQETNAK